MERRRGLTMIGAIVVLSISIVFAASLISNAVTNTGINLSNSIGYEPHYSDYELVFSDGWMYLHEKTTGQIWRKPELSGEPWVAIPHFADEVQYD